MWVWLLTGSVTIMTLLVGRRIMPDRGPYAVGISSTTLQKDKDWVFLLKLGYEDTQTNCKPDARKGYNCDFLYADNGSPSLRKISYDQAIGTLWENFEFAKKLDYNYVMWNDQPNGDANSHAHDKGWMIWNEHSGVLCMHSAPNWPGLINGGESRRKRKKEEGELEKLVRKAFHGGMAPDGRAPGTKTEHAQHFFLVTLQPQEIQPILTMLDHAHVKWHHRDRGMNVIPELSISASQDYEQKRLPLPSLHHNNLQFFVKPRYHKIDYWDLFHDIFCGKGPIDVWSWQGGGLESEHVIDFNDGSGRGQGFGIAPFRKMHAKIGRCANVHVVGLSGWNHNQEQLKRGALFVAIKSRELHHSFRTLFNSFIQE